MQVRPPAGDDVDHDEADPPAQVAGALDRERPAMRVAVLVARADELDRGHQPRPALALEDQDLERVGERGRHDHRRRGWSPRARREVAVAARSLARPVRGSVNVATSISTIGPSCACSSAK